MTLRSSPSNEPPFPRLFFYRGGSGDERTDRWPHLPPISLGWRLFGLVLLCLIPRAVMAWLVEPICHDAYYYISIASAFHDGEWATGFSYLNLNVYPVILVALNSLGLEWIFAGKLWSVVISSLAVLPLFGWIRRLFSDQVAWAAGFLYSLHSEFVERSFEPIRDPTFWFLFNFCLYTTVRALSELKTRWFLANGLALTLAIHTRSEGWLLTIPLVLWLARQLVIRSECRKRLLAGTALCLAVLPGIILLVNLTILRGQPEWQFGRLNHFVVGWKWVQENVEPLKPAEPRPENPPTPDSSSGSPTVAQAPQGPDNAESDQADSQRSTEVSAASASPPEPPRIRKYLKDMASALEQISLGLLVFGLCWSGRELIDWDRGTLFVLAFAIAAAVWIVYDHHGHLNNRYFLPISLALMPYFGLGYLLVFHVLWNRAERLKWSWLKPQYTAIFLILLSVSLGWIDSFTTDYTKGEREIAFGKWLEKEHGPFRSVAADCESARPAYTIQRGVPTTIYHWSTCDSAHTSSHDLLILSKRSTPQHCRAAVRADVERLGFKPLALPADHFGRAHFIVFVRPQAAQEQPAATAETPQTTSRR